jgi:phage replication-related protein YjqB (UPF0714/DUF867 family)
MGTFLCDVLTAYSSQATLMGLPEHCSADPEKLGAIGRGLGHQVRIVHPTTGLKALYTVTELRQEVPDRRIRMCLDGRKRLSEAGGTFNSGTCNSECLRSDLSDAEAENQGEYVERLSETSDSHTGLVACAPHGGMIENYTDEQAERVLSQMQAAAKPCSAWRCKGWRSGGGASTAWHITSTDISPASFPALNQIKDRGFAYAVSFHGYGEDTIAVGGAATLALKSEVAAAIQSVVGGYYEVEVVTSGPYGGTDPANLVNWLAATGGGVQIEQPSSARATYWQQIADAVAAVFAAKL